VYLETTTSRKREEGTGRSCAEKTAGEMQVSFQPASREQCQSSL